jgi:hypothetical protein
LLRVSSAVLLNGQADSESGCVQGDQVMKDDGTGGDVTAGDGIFTSNEIGALTCAKASAARTVRVRAESRAADGRQHATVIEFMPFAIE